VLLLGPPGAGKSMLARRLTPILRAMTVGEAIDTTRIHCVAGLRRPYRPSALSPSALPLAILTL
jgi:magnesium chelatase family protein